MGGLDLDQMVALAGEHQQAGRLRDAEGLYRTVLDAQPKHPTAAHNLGLIALQVGRLDMAQFLVARAISFRPDVWAFHNTEGEIHQVLGRHDEAVSAFDRAIALAPHEAAAQNNRGLSLQALGRFDEAEASFLRAIEARPYFAGALSNLGQALAQCGRTAEAEGVLRRALIADPEDAHGVGLLLAALGFDPLPARASPAHLARLYAGGANSLDFGRGSHLVAELVAAALRKRIATPVDILDAGCGAGRGGALLKPIARSLVGVDLSARLLGLAARRRAYTILHQAELLDFLRAHSARFDAVACAATLIHFGDLGAVFQAAAAALRPSGLFVLTLLPNEADPGGFAVGPISGLAQDGVFVHGRRYVAETAARMGLKVCSLTDETHDHKAGRPIVGLLVVLQAPRKLSADRRRGREFAAPDQSGPRGVDGRWPPAAP